MKAIRYYKMICCGLASSLEHEVQQLIGKGWQPYGSPFNTANAFCQAMVKYED